MSTADVNGRRSTLPTDGRRLVDWLRGDLGLVVRTGCDRGHCGACTVLVDGEPMLACCTVAATLPDADIRTVDSLGGEHPVQSALCRAGGIQCGFCTPGMVMALVAATRHPPAVPDLPAYVRAAIGGNVCRCTGYAQIVEAGMQACREARGE
jgi:carbon-monoxide dehydrogenase small subunit